VCEKLLIRSAEPVEPISCALGLIAQPLELAACPSDDIGIDPLESGTQLRLAEVAGCQPTTADRRCRDCMELFRDQAADCYEVQTGSPWRPRAGSMVNNRALTAAMIDSRDFIAAWRKAEAKVLLPIGPKIALTGGLAFNDHLLI
jgi:hypothetical protein